MEQKTFNTGINKNLLPAGRQGKMEAYIKGSINISKIDPVSGENKEDRQPKKKVVLSPKINHFREKLSVLLEPNLPAKEITCLIVRAALEAEFGYSFTSNKNFGKMVEKIADSIMVNPLLRKQTLAAATAVLIEKLDTGKKN